MLSNKDMFNGMRLIKKLGVEKLFEIQSNYKKIDAMDISDDEKMEQGAGMIAEFLFGALCDAEYEVKKLLAEATGRKYDEVDKSSADKFIDVIEEFLSENSVQDIKDFFGRVVGLISKMR